MWKTEKLGDICYFQSGLWKGKKEPFVSANVIRNTNFGANGELSFDDIAVLDVEENQLLKRKLQYGDIILEKSGGGDKTPVGRVCLFKKNASNTPYSLSNFTSYIRVKDKKLLDFNYLYKFLYFMYITGKTEPMQRHSTGIRNLQLSEYKEIQIALPPLAEQQRIVAKLDAAFAEIDKLIINNEKNLKNSRRIYQYAIDSYFEKNSNNNKIIKNFSKINYGHTAKSSFKKGSYKFLRITDIQEGEVNWESVPYCEVEENKLQNVLLHDGDIVFARTGATTGKSYLLKNPKNAVFASYLIRLSVNKNKLLPKYVYHYFQSKNYWEQINKGISGAAQGGFNASKLGSLQIPIIEMKEQTELTLKLDKIFYETLSLMRLYQKKIEHLVLLKSSILLKELNNKAA